MKKDITEPSREHNLQALINYLGDNGMSDMNADILLHTNMPIFGGYRNMMDEIRDGKWDKVWDAAELYISGDMW